MLTANRIYGYCRISKNDANKASRQIERLKDAGVDERFIFLDKCGGVGFDRPQLTILKNILRQGDLLIITSIDRLSRSYFESIKELGEIIQDIKADIKVLDMPIFDKRMLEGYLEAMRHRQARGIALAKAHGKHLGRPKTIL